MPADARKSATPDTRTWTVVELIDWSRKWLQEKNIADPRLQVEYLLAHVLGCTRVQLYLEFDRPLSLEELSHFKKLLLRRGAREPLQYIVGTAEFFSLPFQVSPSVLIPRPETEVLVEQALSQLKTLPRASGREPAAILDVGTGSGAIAIAFAATAPDTTVTAIDISESALALAQENAASNGVADRVAFVKCDVLDPEACRRQLKPTFDLILSNPPYVAYADKPSLEPEVRDFEPEAALFVKNDLTYYHALARLQQSHLHPEGKLLCETGDGMAERVVHVLEKAGMGDVQIVPDLAGRERVVLASSRAA